MVDQHHTGIDVKTMLNSKTYLISGCDCHARADSMRGQVEFRVSCCCHDQSTRKVLRARNVNHWAYPMFSFVNCYSLFCLSV